MADTLRRPARILPLIDAHLSRHERLALDRSTIADCPAFTYVALAPEGGISRAEYLNFRMWMAGIKALPGFVPMPGI